MFIANNFIIFTMSWRNLQVTSSKIHLHIILKNDKIIGDKHDLEVIDVFNNDATLNNYGLHYNGLDRFVVRSKISKELDEIGALIKIKNHLNKVGKSERTKCIIEPKLSEQWFLKMEKISKPALTAVMEDDVKLFPKKFKNTYKNWMENVRDWNISRQLWWGHQIPVYYYGDNKSDFVVAESKDLALTKAIKRTKNSNLNLDDLVQEEDVLDTWFSSWIWPISVLDGIRNPENPDFKYYYPTNDLVTGPDILFFWVARMIVSGLEFKDINPFNSVYFTGLVRDKQGRKMSKQLGNSPDAVKLIKDFGADSVRVGLLLSAPAGNDLLFDESLCQQGKNFSNKVWNSFRLISSWTVSDEIDQSEHSKAGVEWFEQKFNLYIIIKASEILYLSKWSSNSINFKLNFCSNHSTPALEYSLWSISFETVQELINLKEFHTLLEKFFPC